MPALPNGFESSAAQEVFPGPLYGHALELQLCQLPQRFPGRDLRAQGEVVYMSRGPPVQQLPQFHARRIDHGAIRHDRLARVGCRRTRFRCGGGNQDLGNWPAQVDQDVDRAGGHQSLPVPQQGIRPLGPPVRRVARDGVDLGAARSSLGGGDQRARAQGCPDHHDRVRQAGDDPVPARKVPGCGCGTRCELADYCSASVREPFEQVAVVRGIVHVDSASQHRHRAAFPPKRSFVRRGVDAPRAAGHDLDPGARGIDTAAHEGALWGEGRSVAVLGSGIDVDYPPNNRNLFERLANGGGAVVSELAPGTVPAARNFPRRNRIVAGLSDAVVVVRAALRSGALITAAQAGARGTKVYAVPGEPSNWRAEGSNALLRDGQALVATGPIDVLTDLGWPIPEILVSAAATRTGVPASYPSEPVQPDRTVVDAAGVKLWQLLDGRTPAHVDDLALRAQIPAREALGKLAELELKGMVVQRPGKYFLRR